MTTGERIKYFRRVRGLTQLQLAEVSNVSHSSIKAYEISARNPSYKTVEKIAQALGLDSIDILEGKNSSDSNLEIEKINFISDFKNGVDQLMFFDALQSIRFDIDKIDDKRKRLMLANTLKDLLEDLVNYQNNYKNLSQNYNAKKHWQEKQKFLNNFMRSIENYLEAFEDSQVLK